MFYKILRWCNIHIIFPLIAVLKTIFHFNSEIFERIFINWNNFCVRHYTFPKNSKALILIPHCLQEQDCVYRITKDISNCKACGKCLITNFKDIKYNQNVPVKVATGGTIARRIVKEELPDIIVACACERDLSAGIYDSYPFLVWGICNKRPNGPCINTTVDISRIQDAIKYFCRQ
ncbi:DUF116 domain-containing protein [bacterium]